jgi:hypothetical protein
VKKELLSFSDVVFDLNAFFYCLIDLDIIESLNELLNLATGLCRMLEVKALKDASDVSEPIRVVFIDVSLTPISVAREILSNLVHVFDSLLLVVCPNLGL